MTTDLLFDYLGIRIDGLRAAEQTWHLDVVVTDRAERWRVGIERGALHATPIAAEHDDEAVELVVAGSHAAVAALLFGARTVAELEDEGSLVVTGDRDALLALLAVLDRFSLMFPIVTP